MPLFDFDPTSPEAAVPDYIVGAGGPWNNPALGWAPPIPPAALRAARALLMQPTRPVAPVRGRSRPVPRGLGRRREPTPLFADLLRVLRGGPTDPLF